MILNASGCLDALTAPATARALDAFVTKTVTPLPRGGNPPVRIAETDVGMLNSIGLANPGRERFLDDVLPRLRELGLPIWVSVGGFSAREYAETCERLEDVAGRRAQPLLPERRRGARERRGDRRRLPCGHRPPAVRQAFAGRLGHRRERPRGRLRRRGDGLSLVNTIRGLSLDERTLEPTLASGAGGGYSGPGAQAHRARRRLCL